MRYHRITQAITLTALTATVLLYTAHASAQVGTALVGVPWKPGEVVESSTYGIALDTDVQDTTNDIELQRVVTLGRFRTDVDDPRTFGIGWAYDHTRLKTDDPALPERLVNSAVAVGARIAEVDGWKLGAAAGVGFAGDKPFGDEDGFYGMAGVFARKELDERSAVTVFLDYDGNRGIFPDIPLPAIQYSRYESQSLRYSIGAPFSSLYYAPDDRWSFDLLYIIPLGARATVQYNISDRWNAFATYNNSTVGYHLDGDEDHRRLFFEQSRLEAGAKFTQSPGVTWTIAGGWAFAQEFSRGYDLRDTDTVRELDDAAYVRVGLNFSF